MSNKKLARAEDETGLSRRAVEEGRGTSEKEEEEEEEEDGRKWERTGIAKRELETRRRKEGGGGGRSTVRFYEIKGHIVTGITSIRKRRIQATGRTWN
ncbi:hypothetical protein RF55_7775 [Lasius niger]|uniref:Uncharacterized protein n=1 Tax=Lasius niger TaxID=67767 RepID=A0A0J7KPJ1_LASNI|nr:hypothetical protein RF55_7775 [Lasius niger]